MDPTAELDQLTAGLLDNVSQLRTALTPEYIATLTPEQRLTLRHDLEMTQLAARRTATSIREHLDSP